MAAWEGQLLYGEFQGVEVADSTHADVIASWGSPPPPDVPPDTGQAVDACAGVTTNPSVVFRDSSARVLHLALSVKPGFTAAQVAACLRRGATHAVGRPPRGVWRSPPARCTTTAVPPGPGAPRRARPT